MLLAAGAGGWAADYAVVVSAKTHGDAAWRRVVEALVKKHHATVLIYESSVTEALPALRRQFPRYACFVAQPAEAGREFVAAVHRMTRQFDDDPYPDCFWGILTGYNATNALRIASWGKPLVVHKVAGGTDVALQMCDAGVWYCELNQGRMVKKEPGGAPQELKGPADTTEALAATLTDYRAALFITSGHATEHDWQISYRSSPASSFWFRIRGAAIPAVFTGSASMPSVPGPAETGAVWRTTGDHRAARF
jgi:zinc protease